MKMKNALVTILVMIILFVGMPVYSREVTTFDVLVSLNSPIITRLEKQELSRTRISAFLNSLDDEADKLLVPETREEVEKYFLCILVNVVFENEDFADVCGAFDIEFAYELEYINANNMKLPPTFEDLFLSVMYNTIKPAEPTHQGGGYIPEEVEPPGEVLPPVTEVVPEKIFIDLDNYEWAYDHIVSLSKKNIIIGYPDKSFRPENFVTRGELVRIVTNAFLKKSYFKLDTDFKDVTKEKWYYKDLLTAEYFSLFNKIYENIFVGDTYVTRQEFCTIAYRAAITFDRTISQSTQGVEFLDSKSFSNYSYTPIMNLQKAGVVNGYDDMCFYPHNLVTRAQAAKIIDLLIVKTQK